MQHSSRLLLLVLTSLIVFPGSLLAEAESAAEKSAFEQSAPGLSYERDVRPLLKAACFHCHGESGVTEGGLDVRLVRLLSTGGESGAAIVAGKADDSLLFQRIRDGEMPPDPAHLLKPHEVDTIRRWLDAGAATLRPEPESLDGPLITAEEQAHWSFQPVQRPAVPEVAHGELVANPIDAFILQKLEASGYQLAPRVDRRTLLRRLSFDLLGFPPQPAELAEFGEATAADATAQVIERYLASPHYGERWGRHWLDVAGYADSEGYTIDDKVRPDAWRYRDYVIRSFNEDKPFDRFILEQLAGDELISSPLNNLTPEDAELLVATGFLRMAPDGTGGSVDDANIARNETIAETIKIVTSSLMGVTVGCAQCHDHRYDPIPQVDYYRLRAVFDPAFDWKNWRNPQQRRVSLYTDADRQLSAEIEAEAKQIDAARTAKQQEFILATFEKQLAELPEELQPEARAAYETAAKDRTDEQKSLLKKYPNLNVSAGSLYLYDKKAADELKKMADEAAEIRKRKPEQNFVRATTEIPGKVPESFLFARGDHDQPQDKVTPGGLTVVSLTSNVPEIPEQVEGKATTGRRTALAERLTHPQHPLTARVLVNRIWMHHFGKGIVTTPTDFGVLGIPPTHPELLDWLAAEFIESGWSVKHIHRLILNSNTWQQSVHRDPELAAIDPQNQLYGGMDLRRLEAETVRDSVLNVAGTLNTEMFGAPVPIMADQVGRWVLGIENLSAGRPGEVLPMDGQEFRRSVYVQARRSRPLAVMEPFDLPTMSPNCELRRSSTVAPQSLMLMNSDFALEYSQKLAQRLREAAPEQVEEQIQQAWQIVYGRTAENSEIVVAQEFLEKQQELLEARMKPKKDEDLATLVATEALANLCQMLMSSNEFLYVE